MKKQIFILLFLIGSAVWAQKKTFTVKQIDSICTNKNDKNVELLISNGDKKVLSDKQTASGSHTIKGKGNFKLLVYNLLESDSEKEALVNDDKERKKKKNKILLKGQLESIINFSGGNYEKVTATFYYQNNTIQVLELTFSKKTGKDLSTTRMRVTGEEIASGKLESIQIDGMPLADWIAKKNEEILKLYKK